MGRVAEETAAQHWKIGQAKWHQQTPKTWIATIQVGWRDLRHWMWWLLLLLLVAEWLRQKLLNSLMEQMIVSDTLAVVAAAAVGLGGNWRMPHWRARNVVLHEYYCWPAGCKNSRLLQCWCSIFHWIIKKQTLFPLKWKDYNKRNLEGLIWLLQVWCMMLYIIRRDMVRQAAWAWCRRPRLFLRQYGLNRWLI